MGSKNSILISTPCYGGMVTAAHMASCLNLTSALQSIGLSHDWNIGTNESLVHRARNAMTRAFLESNHSHLMWIDADIEFKVEDFAAVWNLAEGPPHEADIAVGVYAMKKRDEQWFAAWKDGRLVDDLDRFTGPIEVEYAGTGFMMIKRHVLEKLVKKHGTYEANGSKNGLVKDPALYMTPIYNGYLESEDYYFCRIAREAGFKIWMDPSVRLGHIGQYRYGAVEQKVKQPVAA